MFGRALGIATYSDKGEMTFERVERTRTMRKQDKNGLFRWYNEYAMPTGESILMRLDMTDEDRNRKLNRTENLRPIPLGDDDFDRLYRRRNDIESINRNLDDTLWLGRAHSKGRKRQLVNLIGYALMVNGVAFLLHQRKKQASLAA